MSNGDDNKKSKFVMTDNVRAALIVGCTVVAASILLGVGTWSADSLSESVRLPFLVMSGLISLLGVLAAMAIAFKTVRLANQTQALGLPEGTIRAVIALSLILIFAVVTVYLFSALANPTPSSRELAERIEKCCPTTTSTGATGATGTTGTTTATDTASSTTATDTTGTTNTTSAGTPEQIKAAADKAAEAKAALEKTAADRATADKAASDRQTASASAAQDFAKQLLIMLGTLITSITSFYFGSKTATDTSAGKPAPPAPKLTSLDSGPLAVGELPKEIAITGTGLQTVDTVLLRNAKGEQFGTNHPLSSETQVKFTVPKETPADRWDVIVKTRDGGEATMPGALTISA